MTPLTTCSLLLFKLIEGKSNMPKTIEPRQVVNEKTPERIVINEKPPERRVVIKPSAGRAIVIDAKTGKPKSKAGYTSASSKIAKAKRARANTPRVTRRIKGATPC